MNRSMRNDQEISLELERFRKIDTEVRQNIMSVKSEGGHRKDSVNKEGIINN